MRLSAYAFLFPLVFSLPASFADAANKINLTEAIHLLEKSGYSIIQKIKYDKNNYEATVINKQGNKLNVKVNPINGEVLNLPKATMLGMSDTIAMLEKAGYKNIDSLESKKYFYKANVIDAQGKKLKLKVSFDKGNITTDSQ